MWNPSHASMKDQILASASEWTDDNSVKQSTPQPVGTGGQGSFEPQQIEPKQEKKTKTKWQIGENSKLGCGQLFHLFNYFEESTSLLKNMEHHMATILEKLYLLFYRMWKYNFNFYR